MPYPQKEVWNKVKRPYLVTRIVLVTSMAYAIFFSLVSAGVYALIGYFIFHSIDVHVLSVVVSIFGSIGLLIGSRMAIALVYGILQMPDTHPAEEEENEL